MRMRSNGLQYKELWCHRGWSVCQYEEARQNIELPELYTIYPFGLYHMADEDEKIAVDTLQTIVARYGFLQPHTIGLPPGTAGYSGWHYIGNAAAVLGLTELCEE